MDCDGINSLTDMLRVKHEFLAAPGCDVDFDEIRSEVGEDVSEEDLLSRWFDAVAEKLGASEELPVYRHMTVPSFDDYIERLETGQDTAGGHWSLSEDTWSPFPEQAEIDIRLSGTIRTESIDWFSTFQAFFSHPWEQEVVFDGDVCLNEVTEIETGVSHQPARPTYPTFKP